MLWCVDVTETTAAIVAASSAELARRAIWRATAVKFASDDEIRQFGGVIVIADQMSAAEEARVQRLTGRAGED